MTSGKDDEEYVDDEAPRERTCEYEECREPAVYLVYRRRVLNPPVTVGLFCAPHALAVRREKRRFRVGS